jgi:hypothetical protein
MFSRLCSIAESRLSIQCCRLSLQGDRSSFASIRFPRFDVSFFTGIFAEQEKRTMTRFGDVENLFNLFSSTEDWRSSAPLLIRKENPLDVSEFQNRTMCPPRVHDQRKYPDILNPTSAQHFDWLIHSESHIQFSGFEYAGILTNIANAPDKIFGNNSGKPQGI